MTGQASIEVEQITMYNFQVNMKLRRVELRSYMLSHPGFETQGEGHTNSKIETISGPTNGPCTNKSCMFGKLKNVHKLQNLGHSDLVISVCLDLAHLYKDIEGSIVNHVGSRGN